MSKRMFALLALAISLFGTQCWAQEPVPCSSNSGIICTFSPTQTKNTYEFGDGSRLVVEFVTVLTTFTLEVDVSNPTNPLPLDPNEFPAGTVCVQYPSNATNVCDQYDFSGSAGGPHGVPVKNIDYKGLVSLTLSYFTVQTVHNPAFGHAPGDITTFTEDILTSYSNVPTGCGPSCDPTMGGKPPSLSSVIALDEAFTESGDTFCGPLTLTSTNNPSDNKPQVEVTLKIVSGSNCSAKGIRDKTARLSVSTTDINGNVIFPALKNAEGNKFHWDNKNGLNEFDISTDGLVSGQVYTVTLFSSKISPQSATFTAP
jgi:hypothetical protein